MSNQIGKKVVRSYRQLINAGTSAVFPLLCPVREAEWLAGWTYEMIYSESGVAEAGCVFRTQPKGDPETIWMVTQHDAQKGFIEFVRVTAGLAATKLELRLAPIQNGVTAVDIVYTLIPTSDAGVAFVNSYFSEKDLRESVVWWEKSMNHFIKTGQQLKES